MSKAEIWVRDGRDISLRKSHLPDTYTFRITDADGQITIRVDIGSRDLRALQEWIKKAVK